MAGLRTVVLDALPPLGGEAVLVPLAALAATLVASLVVGLCLSRAQGGGRLPARVRSLAARGAAPAEIARRAGTSQDAVALVLRGAPAAPAEQAGHVVEAPSFAARLRAAEEHAHSTEAA